MLLVIAYSREARQSLRNVCRSHDGTVVRQFGRVALFEATEFGAFQALRLREKHGEAIQLEQTVPFNEFAALRSEVRAAAAAYEDRETPSLPYEQFQTGTELPAPTEMKDRDLSSG
ncbi:DUF7855 family protein [Halovenus salina]|uniref:Uncharacterized protein n=1 Tax=Halovenus salina TaxID=1510225 RepID=A0ABD5W4W0_9EURY|nr:hypothetical protein [Halovenus salina]